MKAACEVCGAPLRAAPSRVQIDGAVMVVCANCAKLGKLVGPAVAPKARPAFQQSGMSGLRPMSPVTQMAQRPMEPEYEVDPDYNVIIRQAREKLGLSQEQLGKLLNEKPSVIRMVESKKLKPDVTLTRKLMHELKVNLLVSLSELEGGGPKGF